MTKPGFNERMAAKEAAHRALRENRKHSPGCAASRVGLWSRKGCPRCAGFLALQAADQ